MTTLQSGICKPSFLYICYFQVLSELLLLYHFVSNLVIAAKSTVLSALFMKSKGVSENDSLVLLIVTLRPLRLRSLWLLPNDYIWSSASFSCAFLIMYNVLFLFFS